MYKLHKEVLIMLKFNNREGKNNAYYFAKNNRVKFFSYSLIASALIGSAMVTTEKAVYASVNSSPISVSNSDTKNNNSFKNNITSKSEIENSVTKSTQNEKFTARGKDNKCDWTYNEDTKTLTIKGGVLSATPISQMLADHDYEGEKVSPSDIQYIKFELVMADYGEYLKAGLARNSSSKFANLPNLIGFIGLENVDASNASDLSSLFANDVSLKQLDLSSWDTLSNRDMNSMFKNDVQLTEVNLDNFRTDSVFDFSHMFEGDTSLTTLKLANWKTGNVKNMSYMFNGIAATDLDDITSWQTYNVTNMSYMFNDPNLRQLNLSHWDTGNIFEMTSMLDGLGNNSNGFILSLGKHRLKSAAFATFKMPKVIPVSNGSIAKPAGKAISVAELAKLYDKEDVNCPAETYVSRPITWSNGSIDLDHTTSDNHLPVDKGDSNFESNNSAAGSVGTTTGVSTNIPAVSAPASEVQNSNKATEDEPVAIPAKDEKQTVEPQSVDSNNVKAPRTIYCSIQVYDKTGSPIQGFILKPGMTVETFGTQTINNQKFYKLGKNIFANLQDIEGKKRKIKHNSFVYNKKGKRIRKSLVKKGKSVRVYGNPIKIKKKFYYVIDKNKYIKVNNIA